MTADRQIPTAWHDGLDPSARRRPAVANRRLRRLTTFMAVWGAALPLGSSAAADLPAATGESSSDVHEETLPVPADAGTSADAIDDSGATGPEVTNDAIDRAPPPSDVHPDEVSRNDDAPPASAPTEGEPSGEALLDDELSTEAEEAIFFQEIRSVYGVSKFEQKTTEAPSFVTVVTAEEIRRYGHRTLADILQSMTGFFVTYDRNYNYLGIRGFNRPGDFNTRVLLLVDGHRLNDNLYDQAGIGTESLIDVDLVDRIEVIRGPSSSLYGTNAFLGVINVITKRGRDIRGVEASAEIASWETYRGRLTYGDKFTNGIEMLVSGSYYDSHGQEVLYYPEFNDPATNHGITDNADDDKFPYAFAKVSFRDFTLQGGFVSREKGIPTASYGTVFPTTRTRSTDEHVYGSLKYEHRFENQINLFGRIYYDRFYYQGDYLYDYATTPPPDLVLNRDRSVGEWVGAELKADRRFFDAHNVTAGLEIRDSFRQDLRNADTGPKTTYLDEKRDSRNWAVFLQDEFSIAKGLILNAGVRYDYFDSFGGTINPRAALIYNYEKTTFKALYGRAFRAPNAYERFYAGTGFKSNPALDPETITTYELVLEQAFLPHVRGTVAGYIYRIDDLVSQVTDTSDDLLVFQNADKTEAQGLEFQLETDDRGPLGITSRLGYALQNAQNRRTNGRLTNSPIHLVNANVIVPVVRDRLFAGLEVFYRSKRKTLAGNTTSDYSVTNVTLHAKRFLKGLEATVSVKNLFDSDYSDPGSGEQVQDEIEQNGRSFWLKLKYGF